MAKIFVFTHSVKDHDNKINGAVEIFSDISERESILRKIKELEELSRAC